RNLLIPIAASSPRSGGRARERPPRLARRELLVAGRRAADVVALRRRRRPLRARGAGPPRPRGGEVVLLLAPLRGVDECVLLLARLRSRTRGARRDGGRALRGLPRRACRGGSRHHPDAR